VAIVLGTNIVRKELGVPEAKVLAADERYSLWCRRNKSEAARRTRFTLPWRGKVGERSSPGWGDVITAPKSIDKFRRATARRSAPTRPARK